MDKIRRRNNDNMKSNYSDGEIFTMLLKERKMRVQDIAEMTGLPIQTLYGIKKRTNNRTSQEVINKIMAAMNLPAYIWYSSIDDMHYYKKYGFPGDRTISETSVIKKLYQSKSISPEYVKYALEVIGHPVEYSVEEINEFLNFEKPIDNNLAYKLEYILLNGKKLVDINELSMLQEIRRFSPEAKADFKNMFDRIVDSEKLRGLL